MNEKYDEAAFEQFLENIDMWEWFEMPRAEVAEIFWQAGINHANGWLWEG